MWKLLQVCSLATAAASGNPFAAGNYYVNPAYQTELDKSIATATGEAKANMQKMRNIPSAYWIDKKSKIKGTTTDTLEGILMDAARKPTPPLCVFILYNLPNRDCDSTNSRGERLGVRGVGHTRPLHGGAPTTWLPPSSTSPGPPQVRSAATSTSTARATSTTRETARTASRSIAPSTWTRSSRLSSSAPPPCLPAKRMQAVRHTPCAQTVKQRGAAPSAPSPRYASKVPIAIIIEPDSLPNLATNLKNPHCANTATVRAHAS